MSVGNSKFFLVAFAFAPVQSGVIPSRFPPAIVFLSFVMLCKCQADTGSMHMFSHTCKFLKMVNPKNPGFQDEKYG